MEQVIQQILPDKVYDIAKWFTLIVLPATASAYYGLSQTLNLPYGNEVVGMIAILTTFLGTLLGISTASYNKSGRYSGVLSLNTSDPERAAYSLDVSRPISELWERKDITLRVAAPLPPEV